MGISFGNKQISSLSFGNKKVLSMWNGDKKIYEASTFEGLCFNANESNSTIELCKVGSPNIANTSYSRDGSTWTTFTPSTTQGTNVITLTNVGDKVYFRNDIVGDFTWNNRLQFYMTGSISTSGNINSIHNSTSYKELTTLTYANCYYGMFADCTSLTTAPALPSTTMVNSCYYQMFYNCTSLTTPPELHATIMASTCYAEMFAGCTSLTTIPKLPATTLATNCYQGMFEGCTSLQVSDTQTSDVPYAWKMPTYEAFTDTYSQPNMFYNCLGTRSSNNMSGLAGNSYTYYTQNEPI